MPELPPYRIPSRCWHTDILRTILVNCGGLSFHQEYIHVKAHQDDCTQQEDFLTQAEQLNMAWNTGAKAMICSQDITNLLWQHCQWQEAFPLKPICLFVDDRKMTSDTGAHIRYVAGQQVACSFFHRTSRMFTDAFQEVDWPHVPWTLNKEVPRLFQDWACKQVMVS